MTIITTYIIVIITIIKYYSATGYDVRVDHIWAGLDFGGRERSTCSS